MNIFGGSRSPWESTHLLPSGINPNITNDTQNNLSRRLQSDQNFRSSSQAATQKLQLRHITVYGMERKFWSEIWKIPEWN